MNIENMMEQRLKSKKGGKINICVILSWFLIIGGTMLELVAIATSYWRGNTPDYHEGIFQRCNGADCESVTFFNGTDGELDLVRILMLIGNFYIFLALMLAILNIGPLTAGTILRVLSFVHCIVAMACYIVFYNDLPYQWSFYVCWIGLFFLFVGIVLSVYLDIRKSRDKDLPAAEESEEELDDDESISSEKHR